MAITTLAMVKLLGDVPTNAEDAKITATIQRAEGDYLAIRGIPFELDTDEVTTVYPDNADYVAAEMVCYLLGYGQYQGRGAVAESLSDRSRTSDAKIHGYPYSIVGTIERFQRVQ